jgi:hypothetical protein
MLTSNYRNLPINSLLLLTTKTTHCEKSNFTPGIKIFVSFGSDDLCDTTINISSITETSRHQWYYI